MKFTPKKTPPETPAQWNAYVLGKLRGPCPDCGGPLRFQWVTHNMHFASFECAPCDKFCGWARQPPADHQKAWDKKIETEAKAPRQADLL